MVSRNENRCDSMGPRSSAAGFLHHNCLKVSSFVQTDYDSHQDLFGHSNKAPCAMKWVGGQNCAQSGTVKGCVHTFINDYFAVNAKETEGAKGWIYLLSPTGFIARSVASLLRRSGCEGRIGYYGGVRTSQSSKRRADRNWRGKIQEAKM